MPWQNACIVGNPNSRDRTQSEKPTRGRAQAGTPARREIENRK